MVRQVSVLTDAGQMYLVGISDAYGYWSISLISQEELLPILTKDVGIDWYRGQMIL